MALAALLLVSGVVGGLALVPGAKPALAQQAGCAAAINDADVSRFDSYQNAIEMRYTDTVQMALGSNVALGDVSVIIKAGPFENEIDPLNAQTANRGGLWIGNVSLQDYARYGIGLYEVKLSSDSGCSRTLWVKVTGKSPVATVAGGSATAVMVLGILSQLAGIGGAIRHSKGRWLSMLGGIPVGLGACVFAQQAGWTPLTPEWAAIWTAPPVAIGGVLQGGLSAMLGGRTGRYDGPILHAPPDEADLEPAPPPPPSPPPPPPPTAAEPPVPSAPPPTAAEPPIPSAPLPTGAEPPVPSAPPTTAAEPPIPSAPPVPSAPPPPPVEVGAGGGAGSRPGVGTSTGTTNGNGSGAIPGSTSRTRSAIEHADDGAPRDPPRTSYALLECPNAVVAQEEFELRFGLSATEVVGVAGPALVRPASSIGSYFLTVQIVAEGFDIREGERWRHELPVTADSPYPSAAIHLTPRAQTEPVRSAAIQAIYSVSGQSMGFAVRPIAIVASAGVPVLEPVEAQGGSMVSVPTDEPAADLTVRIQLGEEPGTLLWTFDTPYPLIDVPDAKVTTDIGSEPKVFARKLVDQMGSKEGQPGVYLSLAGIGKTVADQFPAEFWDLLEAVGEISLSTGRPPSVFILSEDPYVPWELALVRKRLQPGAPEFLGAQASVGRWALGKQRPKLPPPNRSDVGSMAVIWGEYNQPGWNRLLEAEKEAADIAALYAALNVNASRLEVLKCLNGSPEADVLHFAVHGIYDPNSVMSGIVLVDGNILDEFEVRGSNLDQAPFVFLNACQVGSGQAILGDYGGMAHAFLYAGAGGVVAPLWSIKDSIARDIATRFYEQAFQGVPPAEILRRERATFQENLDTTSATCMAYIWYGHPSFVLKRAP